MNGAAVLTVGHSTQPAEALVDLLRRHAVEVVIDVRSQPYSRHVPQFNREALERTLGAGGIAYQFAGRELGARSPDRSAYDDEGRVRYDALRAAAAFEAAVDHILTVAEAGRVQALLCTEKDPADCHRAILVGDALTQRGAQVSHILANGRLERQSQLLARLMGPPTLFTAAEPQREREVRALRERERVIAYVDPTLAAERAGG